MEIYYVIGDSGIPFELAIPFLLSNFISRLYVCFTNCRPGHRISLGLRLPELVHRSKAPSCYHEERSAMVRRVVARMDHPWGYDGHVRHFDRHVST